LKNYLVKTSVGDVVFTADSPDPRVLAFHGFKRRADHLIKWRERIPGLALAHLPGHSGSPLLSDVSLETWIKGFAEMTAIWPQPKPIIAESLGALIALSIPNKAVIAAEPPLSVDGLWPLHRTIRRARARGYEIGPEMERLFERPFRWVLPRIRTPTLVLAGDEPLMPPRPVSREPSILTDEDFRAYADHPMVEAHRIPGGHTLMDHGAEAIMATAAPFMARHGFLDSSATP
jgi:pimeloyl-ACP methyl ester carboxylesterase